MARRFLRLCGAALGAAALVTACLGPTGRAPTSRHDSSIKHNQASDSDGVAGLLPTATGSNFHLGVNDPNYAEKFHIEGKTVALRRSDGALGYWNVAAHDLAYASGGSGKTSRLHIYASGGQQSYTWKTQKGFLASPSDLRNQEFTAFVRVHGMSDAKRAAISLKIRGGAHSAKNPDLASCTMMTFQAAASGAAARFGKELVHPIYDYVKLTPRFDAALTENRWFGLKLISYRAASQPKQVVNRLYLDDDPFDRLSGQPRNGWKLFAEYLDVEGVSTGNYAKLADWGGWQTTLRSDGVNSLDFSLLSLREIQPAK